MASFVQYTGNGSSTEFVVPFPFLDRAHIVVTVAGVVVPTVFTVTGSVQITPAPAAASLIDIRRVTPVATPLVDFNDASVLTERDLDKMADWLRFAVEELRDNGMRVGNTGTWDGQARRIANVADPVNSGDVVTKGYVNDLVLNGVSVALPRLNLQGIYPGQPTTRVRVFPDHVGEDTGQYLSATHAVLDTTTQLCPFTPSEDMLVTRLAVIANDLFAPNAFASARRPYVGIYSANEYGTPGALIHLFRPGTSLVYHAPAGATSGALIDTASTPFILEAGKVYWIATRSSDTSPPALWGILQQTGASIKHLRYAQFGSQSEATVASDIDKVKFQPGRAVPFLNTQRVTGTPAGLPSTFPEIQAIVSGDVRGNSGAAPAENAALENYSMPQVYVEYTPA